VLSGYYFTQSIKRFEQGVQIVAALAALLAVILGARYFRRHYAPSAGLEED